jgi:hypothetical protein
MPLPFAGMQTLPLRPPALCGSHVNPEGHEPAVPVAPLPPAADAEPVPEAAVVVVLAGQSQAVKVPSFRQMCVPSTPPGQAQVNSTPGSVQGLDDNA